MDSLSLLDLFPFIFVKELDLVLSSKNFESGLSEDDAFKAIEEFRAIVAAVGECNLDLT